MTDAVQKRPCRGCGRTISLVPVAGGKLMPLDLISPVYRIETDLAGATVAVRDVGAYVTHFASCPKANDFSASKTRRAFGIGPREKP